MADTTSLQSLQPRETKNTLSKMIGGTFEELAGDIFESITGVNRTPDSFEAIKPIKTPIPEAFKKSFSGEFTDFNTPHHPKPVEKSEAELMAARKAVIAEAESILNQSRAGFVTQEEIRHEVIGMSEEERNKRLHLNTSLKKERTEDAYHMAELYRQIKGDASVIEQKKEDIEMPSPAKQPNSLEVAFEGKTGSKGNLSFQAVG